VYKPAVYAEEIDSRSRKTLPSQLSCDFDRIKSAAPKASRRVSASAKYALDDRSHHPLPPFRTVPITLPIFPHSKSLNPRIGFTKTIQPTSSALQENLLRISRVCRKFKPSYYGTWSPRKSYILPSVPPHLPNPSYESETPCRSRKNDSTWLRNAQQNPVKEPKIPCSTYCLE